MAALADNIDRSYEMTNAKWRFIDALASTTYYQGGWIGINATGQATLGATGTAVRFGGVAHKYFANGVAVTTNKPLELVTNHVVKVATTAFTIADIGKPIYAVNDNDLTLTANACQVGVILNASTTEITIRVGV